MRRGMTLVVAATAIPTSEPVPSSFNLALEAGSRRGSIHPRRPLRGWLSLIVVPMLFTLKE